MLFAEIHISSMMSLYPFLLSSPSVGCHYLRMTNVMSFSEGPIFLCRDGTGIL